MLVIEDHLPVPKDFAFRETWKHHAMAPNPL
jgi:hypothetical protein